MKSLRIQLKRFRTIIIILVIVILILGFLSFSRRNNVVSPTQGLSIETVQVRNVEKKVTADGVIRGIDERDVMFAANNFVAELKVNVGDHVEKDQEIAVYGHGDGLKNVFTTAKAPISGIVTVINYKVNDTVSPTSTVGMKIVDNSSYQISLEINENDAIDIKAGQPVKITYPAISLEQTYDGTVKSIDPDSSGTSSVVSYTTIIEPKEIPDNIKLGLSVNVEITTAKVENVLSIPESFLIDKDGSHFVKVLTWKDETKTQYDVAEKEVQIGLRTSEYVEIKSGLSQGVEIVEPTYQPKSLGLFGN